jgi:hypothetical protein
MKHSMLPGRAAPDHDVSDCSALGVLPEGPFADAEEVSSFPHG